MDRLNRENLIKKEWKHLQNPKKRINFADAKAQVAEW